MNIEQRMGAVTFFSVSTITIPIKLIKSFIVNGNCISLKELDLSNFNIEWSEDIYPSVSLGIDSMFYRCHNLQNIILGEKPLFALAIYNEETEEDELQHVSCPTTFYEVGVNVNTVNIYYKKPIVKQFLLSGFEELNNKKFNWIPML